MSNRSVHLRLLKLLLATLLSISAVAPMAAAQSAPGNSGAAHACQKGGFEGLKGTDGTRFASTGECVSFAAHGGELVAVSPNILVSFDPTTDPRFCFVQVDLLDFAPNTTYPVTLTFHEPIGDFPHESEMITNATGNASEYPVGSYVNRDTYVQVTSNGITTAPIQISCAP